MESFCSVENTVFARSLRRSNPGLCAINSGLLRYARNDDNGTYVVFSTEQNRSHYNKRKEAEKAMEDLVASTNARFILISYNNEGTIPMAVFKSILEKYGAVTLKTQEYNTYRGSRNLRDRNNKVQELLWILEKDIA